MGKGSLGNITGAAAVAASSFDMVVRDPKYLLDQLDRDKLERIVKGSRSSTDISVVISEPKPQISANKTPSLLNGNELNETASSTQSTSRVVRSMVQRFGENVDT
jgi:homoaconitate hydratase